MHRSPSSSHVAPFLQGLVGLQNADLSQYFPLNPLAHVQDFDASLHAAPFLQGSSIQNIGLSCSQNSPSKPGGQAHMRPASRHSPLFWHGLLSQKGLVWQNSPEWSVGQSQRLFSSEQAPSFWHGFGSQKAFRSHRLPEGSVTD